MGGKGSGGQNKKLGRQPPALWSSVETLQRAIDDMGAEQRRQGDKLETLSSSLLIFFSKFIARLDDDSEQLRAKIAALEEHSQPVPEPNVPIEELGLSHRTERCLVHGGVRMIGDLLQKQGRDLLAIQSFGVGCLDEVRRALARMGLTLRDGVAAKHANAVPPRPLPSIAVAPSEAGGSPPV